MNRFEARGLSRAVLLAAASVAIGAAQTAPSPDTILLNGHIITVDAKFSIAQAVAISQGKFTAVGSNADIRKLAGPQTATLDLKGQTVIP
ncbi:MAG: amidohydrolase, partial [Acidobacteria bacterium]|nr:amidohydrolase [Acidobacteriota bacterium]